MDTKKLRKANIDKIRKILKQVDYATKSSLSDATSLSIATCGNLLKEMINANEVIELDLDQSSGGRPARRFKYNPNYATVLLVNLMHGVLDTFSYKVVNYKGSIVIDDEILEANISSNFLLKQISNIVDTNCNIKIISISVPGVAHDGIVKDCDIEELQFTNLKKLIQRRTDIKTIINNDVNLACSSYYSSFRKPKPECVIYIFYPTYALPGMGIVINDQIIFGSNNFAGEIKHMYYGLDEDRQLSLLKDYDSFVELFMKQIHTITTILNPSHVIVSGHHISRRHVKMINDKMSESDIKEYLPKIIQDTDINRSIFMGLQKHAILELEKMLKEV